MASLTSKCGSYLASVLLMLAVVNVVIAGDPDILTDFVAPLNTMIDGSFFTYTGMRSLANESMPTKFTVTKASLTEFPALDGQSVSYAVLQYPGGTVNPPHTHPRASELLLVLIGCLDVGFVDTTNRLFTQTLQKGDIFVFPKGLLHFQYNMDPNNLAVALSAFGSASAGTVSVPNSIFTAGIDDGILAKSFKTDIATIQKLKAGDPDILTDFIAPLNGVVNGSFFTYTGMRSLIAGGSQPIGFTATKASLAKFPGLDGESVSYALFQYPGGTVNPPHMHPRASELLVLIRGSLEVGFVDTTNKHFTQTLQEGDIFISPKGLVHYQYNMDPNNLAIAVSAFGSASAGTVSVPIGVFTTGIDDRILVESFKADVATIQKLKAGLAQPSRA